ncbi:TetR/AcrR family transcriptional regulator [Phenylobacterium sp. VNQ135]|uniref:TetR/AcrR family transcriptional regulator n=1 Tax=Phenylobacterium sp. VNQ135 TaxID=3400922 RepID=UPI003C028A1A
MTEQRTVDRRRGRTHLTHEERSAATQERLIEAAIFCLHKYGYAATTTTLVAEEAGFSRGAMLHQFGTKVDLMLAVAQYVVEKQNAFFRQALKAYPRGRERFIGLTDVTWEALSQPAAIALLEIMMASRSDPELGERFPALADELARSQREGTWETAQQAGITDRATVEAMSQLNRAAMQGLSILLMFSKDADAIKPGLDLLRSHKAVLTERLAPQAEGE